MAAMRDFGDQLDEGQGVRFQLVVPVSPQESPPVLPSRGEIVESGGKGVPTPEAGPPALIRLGLAKKLLLEDRSVARRQLADPSLTYVRRGTASSRDLAGK